MSAWVSLHSSGVGLWGRRIREHYARADAATISSTDPAGQVVALPSTVAQAFGLNTDLSRVTRREAMSLPVIAQGRMTICGTIGTFPLMVTRRVVSTGVVELIARTFLDRPDPSTTRQHILTWTCDDLLFHGLAWWFVLTTDSTGYPATAVRIAPDRVTLDAVKREVMIDGTPVDWRRLIRFDGPDEGILAKGTNALRTALLLESAVRRFAVMDVPMGMLKDKRPDGDLTPDEVDKLLAAWRAARAQYGTGYLNGALDYEPVAFNAEELQLTQSRQHMAMELARLMSLDADAVNAPAATGMTYQNGVERRRGRLDATFRPFMAAIVERLSMPDVTPQGQTVTFDTSTWLRGDAAEAVATATAASGTAVMTRDEARARFLDLPPYPGGNPA